MTLDPLLTQPTGVAQQAHMRKDIIEVDQTYPSHPGDGLVSWGIHLPDLARLFGRLLGYIGPFRVFLVRTAQFLFLQITADRRCPGDWPIHKGTMPFHLGLQRLFSPAWMAPAPTLDRIGRIPH